MEIDPAPVLDKIVGVKEKVSECIIQKPNPRFGAFKLHLVVVSKLLSYLVLKIWHRLFGADSPNYSCLTVCGLLNFVKDQPSYNHR